MTICASLDGQAVSSWPSREEMVELHVGGKGQFLRKEAKCSAWKKAWEVLRHREKKCVFWEWQVLPEKL